MLTGLILTDTQRLASLLSSNQNKIKEVIASYVVSCNSYIDWQIVDVSDEIYNDLDRTNWGAYIQILDDYYIGLGLQDRCYCPLFILGGHGVIPMPTIASPVYGAGREYLYSDMAYCFDRSVTLPGGFVSKTPRFAVGRLPVTRGWLLEGVAAYLDDCVNFAANGMPIRGAVMTTTQSWLRASNEMMRDIPVAPLSSDYVPLNNRMVVSPDLDTQYQEMYEGYVHELKKVDFLVCNLHGCDDREVPFFIGEDYSKSRYTMATHPMMMEETAPYIFNTVACYGGRYINYEIDESMMQMSLAYGTLLYCGSCDVSFGGDDMEGNSELLMKLYNIYLHKGIPAGLAMVKAKQDYYRTCHKDDGDEYAMYTILEFNLYGCPILSMQPKLTADYEPRLLGYRIAKGFDVSYNPKTVEVVAGGAHKAGDIHDYVRSLVDNNLAVIRKKVEEQVYQRLGLGKENLQKVMKVSQDKRAVGYQFLYQYSPSQSYRKMQVSYLVNTDINGTIRKIIHTK